MIRSKLKFTLRSLRERLWIKPLGYAVLAIGVVFVAHWADGLPLEELVPDISAETVEKLLTTISASMLGVATFAVASMVSAYASASGTATPRAFVLVVADSLSQTALSAFIGAFIFSIVGIIAIKVGYFAVAGRFALFLFTLAVYALVIVTFVRWVDNIARLGRMGNTIEKVEDATREAFLHWPPDAPLSARPADGTPRDGIDLCTDTLGFIQHVDVEKLQAWASKHDAEIHLRTRPGSLVSEERALLTVVMKGEKETDATDPEPDPADLLDAFVVASRRSYALDPRFGLIAMSEIGSRALSPAVNDPGTAIDLVVRAARILRDWSLSGSGEGKDGPEFDRVFVPSLSARDLLQDAYSAIIKDGVGSVEVDIWIQKTLGLLIRQGGPDLRAAAVWQADLALERAEQELGFAHDLDRVRQAHAAATGGDKATT
ncbi:DUF2254 domain-containing protein [Roseivivax sp. CAU 1753]